MIAHLALKYARVVWLLGVVDVVADAASYQGNLTSVVPFPLK